MRCRSLELSKMRYHRLLHCIYVVILVKIYMYICCCTPAAVYMYFMLVYLVVVLYTNCGVRLLYESLSL